MRNTLMIVTALAMVAATNSPVAAQGRPATPPARSGPAENSLVGFALFDSGLKLISRWGSPEQILPLTVSGVSAGGGGGGGGGAAPGPGGPPPGFGGSGGRGGDAGGDNFGVLPGTPGGALAGIIGDPFSPMNAYQRKGSGGGALSVGGEGGGGRPQGGPGQFGGSGGPGAPGGGGGAPAAASGPSGVANYTRWIYNRDNTRYAFVLDQNNRIIQIEALGIKNSKVRTRKGATFGTSFGQLMYRYNAPEAYEFGGGNMVLRYLSRNRVVFRLAKLDPKKPHVVTGIVIAAGKD